jgi:hypothetical protein
MGLFDTLGMDQVESDPNALPDGKWAGEIFKSEFIEKKNGEVSHVFTYRVTDGEKAGVQRQEWFTLGTGAVKNESGKIVDVENATMTEQAKSWYKRRLENVEYDTTNQDPSHVTGKPIYFGTKKNGDYININFVELREPSDAPAATATPQATPSTLGNL